MLGVATLSGIVGHGRSCEPCIPNNGESIVDFARKLAGMKLSTANLPVFGGALYIQGKALGNYEYVVRNGETIDASWDEKGYFSEAEDNISSWLLFNGDVVIDRSFTKSSPFRPSHRKLFTVMYVQGDLTVNGVVSMTARGARHDIAPVDIMLGCGEFVQKAPRLQNVNNPFISAYGGHGAAPRSTKGVNNGGPGSEGGTGGGGGGVCSSGIAGGGSAGTCFSGGSGGGSALNTEASSGIENGGAGGESDNGYGGAGNPGGSGAIRGGDGTGGVLIVIVEGTLTSNIAGGIRFSAEGLAGGSAGRIFGGGSGGGSVTLFYKNIGIPPGISVSGGLGNGGVGSARQFILP